MRPVPARAGLPLPGLMYSMRTMRSLFALLLMLVALAMLACGGPAGSGKQVVVIYSPHGIEVLGPVERAVEAALPEIDLQCFDLPTATCASRIRAESAAPQADLWWGGPAAEFIAAAEAGLLAPYEPTWIGYAAPGSHDPQHRWHSDWQTPEVIMYNRDAIAPEAVPRDWDDVLDPRWTGRVVIRDPLQSGTMKTIFGAMVLRAEDEEAGFDWLRRLDHQCGGRYAGKPAIMYEQLKRGAGDLTLWNMADAHIQARQGYPFAYVVPTSGTPVVLEGIALVAGGPAAGGARRVFEFLTSAERLLVHARDFDRIPVARADLDPAALPDWMTEQTITPIPIDWASFGPRSTAIMERWKNEIRGQGAP